MDSDVSQNMEAGNGLQYVVQQAVQEIATTGVVGGEIVGAPIDVNVVPVAVQHGVPGDTDHGHTQTIEVEGLSQVVTTQGQHVIIQEHIGGEQTYHIEQVQPPNPLPKTPRRPFDPVAHDLDPNFRLTKFADLKG